MSGFPTNADSGLEKDKGEYSESLSLSLGMKDKLGWKCVTNWLTFTDNKNTPYCSRLDITYVFQCFLSTVHFHSPHIDSQYDLPRS
jgi:hypothetical protein